MGEANLNARKIKVVLKNKRAFHDFEIIQKYEAGIELKGTEVKSIRQGRCNIQDAYCTFLNPKSHELYLVNFHISPYEPANQFNHEPRRPRKLLLHYNQLTRLKVAVEHKGFTIIPLSIYFSGPFVKVEIALVKAKKKFDKRETIKKKEMEREISKRFKV